MNDFHTTLNIYNRLFNSLTFLISSPVIAYIMLWRILVCASRCVKCVVPYAPPPTFDLLLYRYPVSVAPPYPTLYYYYIALTPHKACMGMLRLVRAFTGREKILKFDGCYHGHADGFLVQAGSGVATLGLPDSPGKLF